MANDTFMWRTKVKKDGSLEWERFPPLKLDETLKQLDPRSAGQTYAMGQPTAHDIESELTDEEKRLLSGINDHFAQLGEWHRRGVGAIQSEIDAIPDCPNVRALFSEYVSKFQTEAEKRWSDFDASNRKSLTDHKTSTAELRIFKENNGLEKRDGAHYPDSNYWHLGILFVSIFLEGLANMAFFPQDLGLIGGFFYAFGVSSVNVFLCFVTGWIFLRQINHKNTLRKLIGGIVFATVLVLVFGIHSSVAQYRELAAHALDLTPLNALTFDPRGLRDLESLLLLTVGWVISVVAMIKGYTFDDPYPGFGRIYRKWKAQDDLIVDAEKDYKKQIIDLHARSISDVRHVPAILESKEKEIKKIIGEANTFLQCVKAYDSQARGVANSVIVEFRTAVQRARNDRSMAFDDDLIDKALPPLDPEDIEVQLKLTIEEKLNGIETAKGEYEREVAATEALLKDSKGDALSLTTKTVGSGVDWAPVG